MLQSPTHNTHFEEVLELFILSCNFEQKINQKQKWLIDRNIK